MDGVDSGAARMYVLSMFGTHGIALALEFRDLGLEVGNWKLEIGYTSIVIITISKYKKNYIKTHHNMRLSSTQ